MLEWAKKKALEMGTIKNSIMQGERNLDGFLGEGVVLSKLPGSESNNTFQHDLIYKGHTFDVKTTVRNNTYRKPEPGYVEKISKLNPNQKAEFVIFVSIHRREIAYITSWMQKSVFLKRARFRPPGDVDPDNGQVERSGSYQLYIKELWPPEELPRAWEPREWPYTKKAEVT
jgi:hypothetical protein